MPLTTQTVTDGLGARFQPHEGHTPPAVSYLSCVCVGGHAVSRKQRIETYLDRETVDELEDKEIPVSQYVREAVRRQLQRDHVDD
jgi:hypothetical protein